MLHSMVRPLKQAELMVDLAEYKSLMILIKSFTAMVGMHLTRVDARGNVRKELEAASVSSLEESVVRKNRS